MSSTPDSRRCRLRTIRGSNVEARSRGTSTSPGPTSVSTVLVRLPLQEFPAPVRSCGSYPTCSVSSASNADSSTSLVSRPNSPSGPVNRNPSARACSTSCPASCRSSTTSAGAGAPWLFCCSLIVSVTR